MKAFWLKTIYSPVINRLAKKVLVGRSKSRIDSSKGRFTRGDVREILKQVW